LVSKALNIKYSNTKAMSVVHEYNNYRGSYISVVSKALRCQFNTVREMERDFVIK